MVKKEKYASIVPWRWLSVSSFYQLQLKGGKFLEVPGGEKTLICVLRLKKN